MIYEIMDISNYRDMYNRAAILLNTKCPMEQIQIKYSSLQT